VFEEIKEKMLEQPEHIVNLLELYGFAHIRVRQREIRCAFEHGMNPTAIVIRLQDNEVLFVKDWERNCCYDIINYIIKIKNVEFKDVMNAIKKELGITSIYNYKRKKGLFGGLYDSISRKNDEISVTTYPEEILEQYGNTPNLRFLEDNISLSTQRKFGIGYSVIDQRITIPIRTHTGELMGVKARANFELSEFEPKYLSLINGPTSQTLFGLSENYPEMYEGHLLLAESEKAVLQADSMGYYNVLALGSNSLSLTQAKLILSLNPKSVTFMLDNSLPLENTKRNADVLKTFCKMRTLPIYFFDYRDNLDLDEKDSPFDKGKDVLEDILKYNYFLQPKHQLLEQIFSS
jgi:DNA primase